MRTRRLLPTCCLAVFAAATLVAGSALAKGDSLSSPSGLHAFLLKANEPVRHEFPRSPAFSWKPVKGATRYEFQLAKTANFTEGSKFYSTWSKSPALALPIALPWMTGQPFAAYARVRAHSAGGTSVWSRPFGFNVRWSQLPVMKASVPGLSRWTTVEGATSYDVWFVDIAKRIRTRTNAADHREFYAFHRTPDWMGTVRWRVRAVRSIYGQVPNGLPRVSYGPWSPVFTSVNPAPSSGPLAAVSAVSEASTTSTRARASLHELTPAFTFAGDTSLAGGQYGLFRVYVYSDRDCVNVIYRGAVVGSPAYAPRMTGPLALPLTSDKLAEAASLILQDGTEGTDVFMADTSRVRTTESDPAPKTAEPAKAEDGKTVEDSSPEDSLPSLPAATGAPVDLWDSGWPNGRYFWTVVPVVPKIAALTPTSLTSAANAGSTSLTVQSSKDIGADKFVQIGSGPTLELVMVEEVDSETNVVTLASPLKYTHSALEAVVPGDTVQYWDVDMPQDACAAGREIGFGKQSSPVVAGTSTAFASGLSPQGRLVAARGSSPLFFGAPVVAWLPALGADTYQVEWSRKAYPWKALGRQTTQATAATLPLKAGVWFYRVRGINNLLPGSAKAMTWSKPQLVKVARPKFKVMR
jgi:hypothetical protein